MAIYRDQQYRPPREYTPSTQPAGTITPITQGPAPTGGGANAVGLREKLQANYAQRQTGQGGGLVYRYASQEGGGTTNTPEGETTGGEDGGTTPPPGLFGSYAGDVPDRAEAQGIYEDVLKQHDTDWQTIQSQVMANQSAQLRRMGELNAAMGRGMGGGLGAMQTSALIGTAQEMAKAGLEFGRDRRQVQLGWLDRLMGERNQIMGLAGGAAETERYRTWQGEQGEQERQNRLDVALAEQGVDPNAPDTPEDTPPPPQGGYNPNTAQFGKETQDFLKFHGESHSNRADIAWGNKDGKKNLEAVRKDEKKGNFFVSSASRQLMQQYGIGSVTELVETYVGDIIANSGRTPGKREIATWLREKFGITHKDWEK